MPKNTSVTLGPHFEKFIGQQVASGHYRVLGTVSIRRLAKHLGIDVTGEGITTVAGFIQRHNERLPRLGDAAPMGPFTLTVTGQNDDEIWIDVKATESATEDES